MKPKALKITFWIITILFCLANFLSGIAELFPNQQAIDAMAHLGYPAYLLTILGVAKVAGSIAILQTKFRTIKEWAYAGFVIDYIGASLSIYFSGDGLLMASFPMIFLVVLFVSYSLWKKTESKRGD
ncbi:DoxX family protein [Candidatus Woesearchaeota archaeon]|nr:DoxX family protein [Candidatus Woesearchaeota archaeon]